MLFKKKKGNKTDPEPINIKELKYFYKELPYGDPQAGRFEEGAKKIVRYRMPCIELTIPYTVLTWIMVDFLTGYYISDMEGFEEDSDSFWARAKSSALYQYEIRVNNSSKKYARTICQNVVKTYKSIAKNGYNLAKPVPVAENPKGEIVAVKGAKRIAALLAFGFDWVTVMEYDPNTFVEITPEQAEITCIDHANLIFSQLSDLPSVKVLKARYGQYMLWKSNSGKKIVLTKLRELIKKFDRQEKHQRLKKDGSSLAKLINELDPVSPNRAAIVINNEVELIEWLYLRNIPCQFIVAETRLYEQLKKLCLIPNFQVTHVSAARYNDIASICPELDCQELWCSREVVGKIGGNNAIKIKEF